MAERIQSKHKSVTDAQVIGFVARILNILSGGQSLRFPPKLLIIDDSDLIASALPGGFLIFSSGAILHADSEAELAGLLAHAIGHVQAGPRIAATGRDFTAIFLGGDFGFCTRGGAMPVPSAYSDLNEPQSDLIGLEYLAHAGYDPQALVTVFDRWPGKYLPNDEVRSKAAALSTGMVMMILNTSAFDQIKSRLQPPRRVPSLNR